MYFTILISHTTLAVAIVLVIHHPEPCATGAFDRHRKIARWTFPLWLYVSVTGVAIYVMRYHLLVASMAIVKLKIDVSGTVGDEVWRNLRQFEEIQDAAFGPKLGSSGVCKHPAHLPHAKGEWIAAEIQLETPLLAQYAVSHYLEQDRVLDADLVGGRIE